MILPDSAAILVGGQSKRMGKHKALLALDGGTLLESVCSAVRDSGISKVVTVGLETLTSGDQEVSAAFRDECENVADLWPGEGPLGALITALGAGSQTTGEGEVLVLPVDLPALTGDSVAGLVHRCTYGVTTLAVIEDRLALPIGVWQRSDHKKLLERFNAGERAVWRAIKGLEYRTCEVGSQFVDADNPKDFANFGYH